MDTSAAVREACDLPPDTLSAAREVCDPSPNTFSPASHENSFPQPHHTSFLPIHIYLLEEELKLCDNPHLTYETIVLRLVKRLLAKLQLPWSHVLETVRQGPYLLDKRLQRRLQCIWNHRKRQVTLDEQHCVERVLGHDHNRAGDLTKLAGILNKIADPVDLYTFFAVDGFLGDDPRRYIDAFRYGSNELQYRHVQAVRHLYDNGSVENPVAMRELLESIFGQREDEGKDGDGQGPKDLYVSEVGGWQEVKEIAEWRREQEEKNKKKRSNEDDRPAKVSKTED